MSFGDENMTCIMLAKISFFVNLLAVFAIVVCLLLILIVLLQKGKGDGLAAAFGGAGGQSAFGSKTGDMFTWVTIGLVAVFLTSYSVLSCVYKAERYQEQTPVMNAPANAPAPTEPSTAPPAESTPEPETPAPTTETPGNTEATAPATPPAPTEETTPEQEK